MCKGKGPDTVSVRATGRPASAGAAGQPGGRSHRVANEGPEVELDAAGIERHVSMRELRHTFVTLAIEAGMDPRTL